MRINMCFYACLQHVQNFVLWLFIVTTVGLCVAQAEESTWAYDSSIQRSNFMGMNPNYVDQLDEKLSDRRAQFLWKLRFDAQSLQTDGNIQSQIAGANFIPRFRYRFIENLEFKAKASLNLESGRSQDIFGDQEPGSGIYPMEALIEYAPFEDNYMSLKAGLIQQKFFNQSLFVARLPFMGFSERFAFEKKRYEIALRLQQLIPTAFTNSTRVSQKEETPYFSTESLEGRLSLSRWNFVKGRLTHFRYQNLPAVVAFDSFLYGNTVTNTDVNNAQFIYQFNGFMYQFTFEQKFSHSLSAQLQWSTIINDKAPADSGEAQMVSLGVANDFGRWILAGKFSSYFIESDAVPARYNSYQLGHNNRIGYASEINLESKDWGVIFKTQYVKANLLNSVTSRIDGLQQDNQQTFYFAVETMYDFI